MGTLTNWTAIELAAGNVEFEANHDGGADDITPEQADTIEAYAEGVTQMLDAYAALGRAFGILPQFA